MKKILLIIFTLFFTGCYAREMILIEPEVSFREFGIKNVLFIGFLQKDEKVEISPAIKSKLNKYILKNFQKFDGVNILLPEENEISNVFPGQENIISYSKKYKTDIIILGIINDYKELKYVEQPVSSIYQTNTFFPNGSSMNKNIISFQAGIDGALSFIKPDGKVLWLKKLSDVETSQFEDLPGGVSSENNETTIFESTREKLIENISNQIIVDLLPYYIYR